MPRHRSLLIFLAAVFGGVTIGFMTTVPSVTGLYILSFVSGLGTGAFETGGNVFCLDVWRKG